MQIRPKMRSKLPVLAALVLSCSAVVASAVLSTALSTARADELRTPRVTPQSTNLPARGMSMEKVEAAFGAPSNRSPAVGEPPITRWEYPGFVVYFEHQLVIHTVGVS